MSNEESTYAVDIAKALDITPEQYIHWYEGSGDGTACQQKVEELFGEALWSVFADDQGETYTNLCISEVLDHIVFGTPFHYFNQKLYNAPVEEARQRFLNKGE